MTGIEQISFFGGITFVIFGLVHVAMSIYLHSNYPNSQYYKKLKISYLLVGLLIAIGVIVSISTVWSYTEGMPGFIVYVKAIILGMAFPLGILGIAWFWGVGLSLLSKPVKEWKVEITRS